MGAPETWEGLWAIKRRQAEGNKQRVMGHRVGPGTGRLRRRGTEDTPPKEAAGSFLRLTEKAHLPVGSKGRALCPLSFP